MLSLVTCGPVTTSTSSPFLTQLSVWKAGGSIQATVQYVHSTKDYLGHMEDAGCKC